MYKNDPASLSVVENDTKQIGRKIIKMLMARGTNPRDELLGIYVNAYKYEKGETGANLTQSYGETSYDRSIDQLVFEPAVK
jgi:hypothetical protein